MMTSDAVEAVAQQLEQAERTRRQIGLLSLSHPAIDMEDAYAIQAAWMRRKFASGRRRIGWKIGLTSKAMQSVLGIDTPDSGVLLDDMLFEDGAAIGPERFIQPRIEAEIAFVMKEALQGPGIGPDQVLQATDYVTPALEILDARILRKDPGSGRMRTVFDTIADNAANAGIVLGGQRIDPRDADMRWIGAIVSRNGEVEETGLAAGVLDDPVTAVVWLVNRLALYGASVAAGEIVLSGSFIRPIEATPGSDIVADYGPYGRLCCSFS